MQNFVGEGYSEAFTHNMKAVLTGLASQPEQELWLIQEEDVLCCACPHHQNGCVSGQKVERLDAEVLRACGITAGETISWKDFRQKIEKIILKTSEFDRICGDCQWFTLCKSLVTTRMGETE